MDDDKRREHCHAVTRALLDINSAKNVRREQMDAMFLDMAHSADSMEELDNIMAARREMMEFAHSVTLKLNEGQRLMRGEGWWDGI